MKKVGIFEGLYFYEIVAEQVKSWPVCRFWIPQHKRYFATLRYKEIQRCQIHTPDWLLTMIVRGIACSFLLWSILPDVSSARECGTAITEECKSRWDRRYEPNVSTDLTNLASDGGRAWERIGGLYRGTLYTYDPDYSLSRKVDGEDVWVWICNFGALLNHHFRTIQTRFLFAHILYFPQLQALSDLYIFKYYCRGDSCIST